MVRVYDKPTLPKIDWHQRERGYMSLNMQEYRELRTWVIRIEGIVNKYENQSKVLNGG